MNQRPIRFRAWDKKVNHMFAWDFPQMMDEHIPRLPDLEWMQFTGLFDKNGVTEVYEGDMIDVEGNIIGNIYESPQIYKEGTYLTIEGMGTSAWRNTESTAMGFGLKYAE